MDIRSIVKTSKKIWLSTHISADGDGLGSEFAFFHALKKANYEVSILHNDPTPKRYSYLLNNIDILDANAISADTLSHDDICFIFDTHDPKLCQPLIEQLDKAGVKIIFVDHHVTLLCDVKNALYFIDENASCTGELTLELIEKLDIQLDENIATCLYTSLIFDTQNFKTMRDPIRVLEMAKKLVIAGADHKNIHRHLFENWTVNKFDYLSKLIKNVTYTNDDTAIIRITRSDLHEFNLSPDEVSDLVDFFMGLKNLQVSIVIREESADFYKLSFRSRKNEILSWAREFGGGGHLYSAGAWVKTSEKLIIEKIHALIKKKPDNI